MCESRVVAAWLLLSVAGVLRVTAQSAADYRRRLDSLTRRGTAADSLVQRRRATMASVTPFDTIHVGGLTVVALRSAHEEAAAIAESAWVVLASTYGRAAEALAGQSIALAVPTQNTPPPPEPGGMVWAEVANPLPLVINAARLMAGMADSALREWESGPFVPLPRTQEREDLQYVELVTSPWHRVQECYRDRLASCRLALGLEGRDSAATRWYDTEDRKHYVRMLGYRDDRCLTQVVGDACVESLHRVVPGPLPTPFSHDARMSLWAFALSHGGAGAYERLITEAGQPLAERLGAAAGLSSDSLIVAWRARVLAARPNSVPLTTRGAWTAVCWCLLLAVVAMRSSRWR